MGYNCEIIISALSDPMEPSTSEKKPIQKKEPKGTPGKRKSSLRNHLLWQYFEEEQNSQEVPARAVCKECRTFVKRADGSTTLMKTHLKNYHPDLYKQYNTMLTKANLEKVKKIQFS
jgi:hypothetical protein